MKMSSLPNFWFSESYSTDRRIKSISVEILKDYHQEDWQFVGKSNSRNFCYEEVFFRENMNMLLYSFSLLFFFCPFTYFFNFSLNRKSSAVPSNLMRKILMTISYFKPNQTRKEFEANFYYNG